jgi:hypothetical protein
VLRCFVFLSVLVVAGCGGNGEPSAKQLSCREGKEQAAAEVIARRAYNEGRLGTAKQLASHFSGPILDSNGKLPPPSTLPPIRHYEFDAWIHSGAVRKTLGDQMLKARLAVRQAHWPGC